MQGKTLIILAIMLAVAIAVALVVTGCMNKPEHHIDYNGQEDCYKTALATAREGSKVKLYYWMIATDTDYAFYLDDERIHPDYDEKKGFIVEFTMPDHDVSLRVEHYNSMVFVPNEEPGDPEGGVHYER